jgi:ribosomal protein S18 acetylase RimI-like enzyme
MLWRALRLEALREAPSAFGSALADWQGAGDTESRWRDRLARVAFNVVAFFGQAPVGMVSGNHHPPEVELISMWVAPLARGKGVGDQLVDAVVDWATVQGALRVVLSVKTGNCRAIHLYQRHQFVETGPSPETLPGSPEVLFLRNI